MNNWEYGGKWIIKAFFFWCALKFAQFEILYPAKGAWWVFSFMSIVIGLALWHPFNWFSNPEKQK